MLTLGINAAFHDSSACLVEDGRVRACSEEERFTRVKHAKRPTPFSAHELPFHAIDDCLRQASATIRDLEHVAYSYDPAIRLREPTQAAELRLPLEPSAAPVSPDWDSPWEPLRLASIVNAPRHLRGGVPHHLGTRLGGGARYHWHFVAHHLAHAASAFLASPYDEAAVMVIDGRGENATTSYALGRGTALERLGQVDMPHSIGLLYERVTEHLGFLHSSDEYKVMALASFGQPHYAGAFRDLIRVTDDGRYTIAPASLDALLGPARPRGAAFETRHYDIARSIQTVLEEIVLALAQRLRARTRQENLCLAGGVALNCVMNARLRDRGPFKRIWMQPAAGDAGTALGAALWIDARARNATTRAYRMEHAQLGPEFDDDEIERTITEAKLPYRRLRDAPAEVAALLAADKIVGWFQGRMEFGPRALGNRSILASPLHAPMASRLNALKDREDFRPVAPAVLEKEAAHWFTPAAPSPFMLFVCDALPVKAACIPAACHVDGSARIQTVRREHNPRYYDLIEAFQARTGVPILINTSFNARGEPIVCTPRDALACFATTPIDALAIGPFLLEKTWSP